MPLATVLLQCNAMQHQQWVSLSNKHKQTPDIGLADLTLGFLFPGDRPAPVRPVASSRGDIILLGGYNKNNNNDGNTFVEAS